MRPLEAKAVVSDLGSLIAAVGDVADETGATVQASDAQYVAGREYLERVVELADRAIARGDEVARDCAVEILLYASGRWWVNRVFETGASEGMLPVVVLVDSGDEAIAKVMLFNRLDFELAEILGDYDESLIRDVFDVGKTELHVVDGDLSALVRERMALLAVDR